MIMSGQNNPFDHYYIILTGLHIPHLRIILPLTSTLVRSKCLHSMRMASLLSEMSSVVIWSRFSIRHQKMLGQTGPSIVKWLTIMDLQYFTRSIEPLTPLLRCALFFLPIQYPHFCMWPDKIHDGFRDGLYRSPLGYLASRLMGNSSVRVQNTFTMGTSSVDYTIPQYFFPRLLT